MRGFHDDRIKTVRLLSMSPEERAIKQVTGPATDHDSQSPHFQHHGRARMPKQLKRLTKKVPVRNHPYFGGHLERLIPRWINTSAQGQFNLVTNSCCSGGLHCHFINDWSKQLTLITCVIEGR